MRAVLIALAVSLLFVSNIVRAQTQANYFFAPPPVPVRTMAEWEELQAICITWKNNFSTSRKIILSEIVRAARLECKVIIACESSGSINFVKDFLTSQNVDFSSQVEFIVAPSDTIWIRDFGPNCVYYNDVDSLAIVDWIYNRAGRVNDDAIPGRIANYLNLPVFAMTTAPYDLVHTGGNFMTDGLGTGFSSELIFRNNNLETDGECDYFNDVLGFSNHTEVTIDSIMQRFMGIKRYIKLHELPYDCIHHIDMHIKLLDEETLLVGQYPEGIADGPQIEANLQYIINNFQTAFGTPFKVVRIPMPPDANGDYPDVPEADYRTYVNSVMVNKTILVPGYEEKYDTTALRIWKQVMPGYQVVLINSQALISASGALHCITREIGASDPLRIVHQPLRSVVEESGATNGYNITALIQHRSGIANAQIHYRRKDEQTWKSIDMASVSPDSVDYWRGWIPQQPGYLDSIYYYISANSVNGKTQMRPLPGAPAAWRFMIKPVSSTTAQISTQWEPLYPNPTSALTVIPINADVKTSGRIALHDAFGRELYKIYSGQIPSGPSQYFFDAKGWPSGVYYVSLQTENGASLTQKLLIK
ncbi:MAG: agmatine deiminase family protein [Saprospiraceae bacterium]|nr:agmatine deiminase family protein [Saprospiraceae bacterium]